MKNKKDKGKPPVPPIIPKEEPKGKATYREVRIEGRRTGVRIICNETNNSIVVADATKDTEMSRKVLQEFKDHQERLLCQQ